MQRLCEKVALCPDAAVAATTQRFCPGAVAAGDLSNAVARGGTGVREGDSGRMANSPADLCYDAYMDRETAISRLKAHEAELRRLGVQHLWLFGSTVRGEAGADSDVDLFFDHEWGKLSLFDIMEVQEVAARILGCDTDVMTAAACTRPYGTVSKIPPCRCFDDRAITRITTESRASAACFATSTRASPPTPYSVWCGMIWGCWTRCAARNWRPYREIPDLCTAFKCPLPGPSGETRPCGRAQRRIVDRS
jgi:predicted nucleotidyltransferase